MSRPIIYHLKHEGIKGNIKMRVGQLIAQRSAAGRSVGRNEVAEVLNLPLRSVEVALRQLSRCNEHGLAAICHAAESMRGQWIVFDASLLPSKDKREDARPPCRAAARRVLR
jgi:hypothetical protein